MKYKLFCLIHFFICIFSITSLIAHQNYLFEKDLSFRSLEDEAQAALHYLCYEVERDTSLAHEEQDAKIQEFKNFADHLSPEVASRLVSLLLHETRSRILCILQNADLGNIEIEAYLADYENAILKVQNMTVEIARQMLFFVEELKIHRQYVHDFGIALGCPKKQLQRHDLCKLSANQFEGYACYFRGGRQVEDRPAFLAAWELHQLEEHHLEFYSKKGFDFDSFSKERLKNNMLEVVADWLAASKQRGGVSPIDYLTKVFPKKNHDPRLLPYLKDALIKAHGLYLESKEDPASDSLFKSFPCWNSDVEKVFLDLQNDRNQIP